MDFDANISFLRTAFWEILTISGPILGVALVIGLLVGIFQAATSINEMTLAFVPKVVLVFVAFGFLAPYILTGLTDYFGLIFETIRSIS
ncbi:MAG: flagellar biosynthetic protein FliQ [Rhodobacteraceae bacterium]|nr:MAG: flagellar biosynthetic protein FliQ [Paracoccaceae bacterium]|tara:strand:+ start:614 stop:880 length:267 start_codon:yes stop_codon:yes gene_type:complete